MTEVAPCADVIALRWQVIQNDGIPPSSKARDKWNAVALYMTAVSDVLYGPRGDWSSIWRSFEHDCAVDPDQTMRDIAQRWAEGRVQLGNELFSGD